MFNSRIITLMFHRVNDHSLNYTPEQFANYLQHLANNYPIVLPGDPIPKGKTAICLTFDDGYFDFYQDVFPLLKQWRVPAILAVPVKYIIPVATQPAAVRLSVPYAHNMDDIAQQRKEPFCSWQELKEMSDSNLVEIASHGYRHANLAHANTNLTEEIVTSKNILETHLGKSIRFFIYPFGAMNEKAHQLVQQHYEFGIRIGSALNLDWDRKTKFVYRINADPLWTQNKPINKYLTMKLTVKYYLNRIRNK